MAAGIDPLWWRDLCTEVFCTGSYYLCRPRILDTDIDYIALVDTGVLRGLEESLRKDGYVIGGSGGNNTEPLKAYPSYDEIKAEKNIFHSWKKDNINVIVTCCEEYFENFTKASRLCRELNLKTKDQRIALFTSICRDHWPSSSGLWLKERKY